MDQENQRTRNDSGLSDCYSEDGCGDRRNQHVARIALEGVMGAGKTTIIHELQKRHSDWICFQEPIDYWRSFNGRDYLQTFLDTPTPDNCLALQKVVFESYKDLLTRDIPDDVAVVIFERSALAAVQAIQPAYEKQGQLTPENCLELLALYKSEVMPLENMEGWVYLRADPQLCRVRMKQRDTFTSGPPGAFAQYLHEFYDEMFLKNGSSLGRVSVMEESADKEQSVAEKVEKIERFVGQVCSVTH